MYTYQQIPEQAYPFGHNPYGHLYSYYGQQPFSQQPISQPINGNQFNPYFQAAPYATQGQQPLSQPISGNQAYPYYGQGQQLPYQSKGYPFTKPKQPSPIMSAFMTPEGRFDFQKTFYTVDQIVKTANQIPPIFKQFSSLLPKR